jgi:hypothetical protein
MRRLRERIKTELGVRTEHQRFIRTHRIKWWTAKVETELVQWSNPDRRDAVTWIIMHCISEHQAAPTSKSTTMQSCAGQGQEKKSRETSTKRRHLEQGCMLPLGLSHRSH